LESVKNDNFEVKEINNTVLIKKNQQTIGGLLKEYKRSFGLFFGNLTVLMIIIGCFIRIWQYTTFGFFMSNYMKVYDEDYQNFTEQATLSSMTLGPISTLMIGVIIDYFGPKSDLTITILILVKTALNIPFQLMIFA
jgi:hypothetical protein